MSHNDGYIGGLGIDSGKTERVVVSFSFEKQTPKDSSVFLVDLIQSGVTPPRIGKDGGERFIITYHNGTSAVSKPENTNPDFSLDQNAPNPVTNETRIRFTLRKAGEVQLVLCDMLGRELRTLAEGRYESGVHLIPIVLDDLRSGTYFYRITVDGRAVSRSLIILK